MGLTSIPEKTDEDIGREKSDAGPFASLTALVEAFSTLDLDVMQTAAEGERLKDHVIAHAEAIGLGDGSTVGSLEARFQPIEAAITVAGTDVSVAADDDLTLSCADVLGLLADDGSTPVSLALKPDAAHAVQVSVDGTLQLELTSIGLQVPSGFNATVPGLQSIDYAGDALGFDWFGSPGRLRIAGRVEMVTGEDSVLPASDLGIPLGDPATRRWSGIYGGEIGSTQWKCKAAPQTRTNTTTLATDGELFVDVAAAGVYAFRAVLFVTFESGDPGIKAAMGGSATATGLRGTIKGFGDDGAEQYFYFLDAVDSGGPGFASAAGEYFVELEGSVTIDAAGTFGVRWAQGNSDADDTTVRAQSTLEVRRCL